MDQPELRDYLRWHDAYDDPTSELSARLRRVQQAISDWYDTTSGDVTVMSSCAGQGADILGVLERRPELRSRTHGTLVELLPENARIARERIDRLQVDLEVREADASFTDAYAGAVPADLVLLSGIMGNITPEDIHRLIATAPQFCAPGGVVLWTRNHQSPDPGEDIRRWFDEAGFEQVAVHEHVEGTRMRVGVERLVREPEPLQPGVRLFTFFR